MSKITAKHYLNTNLKPYLINGEKHFSVYLMVIALRQNTKVKSIILNEYYSEENFNDIINSKDKYYKNLLENEINTIINIATISMQEFKNFDTAFVTAFFKFSATMPVQKCNEFYYLKSKDKNLEYDFYLEDFLNENLENCRTLFDFYNLENQKKLSKYLLKNNNNDVENLKNLLNEAYFYYALEDFKNFIKNSKSNYLVEKYNTAFNLLGKLERNYKDEFSMERLKKIDIEKYFK